MRSGAGFPKQRFYEARQDDPAFADAWEDALERGTQVLEQELHRLAMEGWDEHSFGPNGAALKVAAITACAPTARR